MAVQGNQVMERRLSVLTTLAVCTSILAAFTVISVLILISAQSARNASTLLIVLTLFCLN